MIDDFAPGMHSYADQAGFYPPDAPRQHNATEVGRIIARYIAETSSFDRGNARVKAEMASTTKTAKSGRSTWASYGKYLVLGVGGMVLEAAKSFAIFDKNMNVFQANLSAGGRVTARQMDIARARAKQLGADAAFPGVTAAHVAETYVELSKAGMNFNQTMSAIRPTMLLGTAGQMDYAEAGNIVANSMNAFNLKGKQVGKVADYIAGAALKSSASVEDVAEAFRYTSSAAAGLGVPIQQATTLTGLLSNLGLKGSFAGSSMRMFFTSIAKPRSNAAADLLGTLHLLTGGTGKHHKGGTNAFFNKDGTIKDLNEIFALWQKHTKNLTLQQKVAAEHTIFGQRGMNVGRAMDRFGAKGFNQMMAQSTAGAGTKHGAAMKLAAANTKGLYGAYQKLINVVQTLGLELGQYLAPYLIKVANELTKVSSWVEKNQQYVRAFAKGIVYATIAVGAIKAALLLWKAAQVASTIVQGIATGAMYAYRFAILAIKAPMAAARYAMYLFNLALEANPIGIVIIAITAIILILRHYGVSMKDVIRWTHKVWDVMKDVFQRIKGVVQWCIEWIKQHWKLVIAGLVAPIPIAVLLIITHFHDIVKFLKNKLAPLMWSAIKEAFKWLWGQMKTLGPQAYKAGHDIGDQIHNGLKDAVKGALKSIGQSMWDDIKHPLRASHHSIGAGILDQARHLGNKSTPSSRGRGGAGPRAMGGTVWSGSSYLVGEKGPEMFTPGVSGRITPNGGGRGPTVNIEHMSVRSEEDPYVIASVLSHRMVLAQ